MDEVGSPAMQTQSQGLKACKPLSRECPMCGLTTIKGMPGGRDATCTNCGYKDPCCYD